MAFPNSIILSLLLISFSASSATTILRPVPQAQFVAAAGGAAPTFIAEYELDWTSLTTPKTTAAFDVQTGDILLVCQIKEGPDGTAGTPTGGTLTYNLLETVDAANLCELRIWSAVVDANKNMTVQISDSGSLRFAANILHFRGSSGIGAAESTSGLDAVPQIAITTTLANSAIVVFTDDFEASGTSPTWVTATAGALTQVTFSTGGGAYTIWGGYHANAGAIGAKTVGLSVPTGPDFTIGAVEVKGTP